MHKTLGNFLLRAWKTFSEGFVWVNELLLLGIVYFLLFPLIALPMKLFHYFSPSIKSTWRDYPLNPKDASEAKELF